MNLRDFKTELLNKPTGRLILFLFASGVVLAAGQDREWLAQATRVLTKYWRDKNSRKRTADAEGVDPGKT